MCNLLYIHIIYLNKTALKLKCIKTDKIYNLPHSVGLKGEKKGHLQNRNTSFFLLVEGR